MPEQSASSEPIFHEPKLGLVDRARQAIRKDPYAPDPQAFADNLRIEMSLVTPEQQSTFEATASSINHIIRNTFGKYIPEDVMRKEADIEKRIVVVDKDEQLHYEITIDDLDVEPEEYEAKIGPYADTRDDVIVITRPTSRADQVGWRRMSKKMKKSLIKANSGNEESAQTEGNYRFFLRSLYHEIGHVYQPVDLPGWFREAHVYHLSSELYKGYEKDNFDSYLGEGPMIDAYQELLEKHGKSVRMLSFGTPIPDVEKRQILEDFKTILKQTPGGHRFFARI